MSASSSAAPNTPGPTVSTVYLDILDDLPRTENGKVQKFKLRERGVSATTWDRERQPLPARDA